MNLLILATSVAIALGVAVTIITLSRMIWWTACKVWNH